MDELREKRGHNAGNDLWFYSCLSRFTPRLLLMVNPRRALIHKRIAVYVPTYTKDYVSLSTVEPCTTVSASKTSDSESLRPFVWSLNTTSSCHYAALLNIDAYEASARRLRCFNFQIGFRPYLSWPLVQYSEFYHAMDLLA